LRTLARLGGGHHAGCGVQRRSGDALDATDRRAAPGAHWVGTLVRRLADRHEVDNPMQWSVDDAPATFVAGQLRAIVGVELVISRVEAKAKLSQNRAAADIEGVITGLEARGDTATADAVRAARP